MSKSAALLLFSLLLTSCAESDLAGIAHVAVVPGVTRELAEYRAAVLSDIHYELEFTIPASKGDVINGEVRVTFTRADSDEALQLDFRENPNNIHSVRVNDIDIEPRIENEHVVLPADVLSDGVNEVAISFVAGDSSLNRNPDYLYTLFVPDRARTAFPLFDQPDLKATFSLALSLPDDWTAMSNAPMAKTTPLPTGSKIQFEASDLISSYLFSFVAGKFDRIERDVGGRQMTMLHRETDAEKVARNVDDIFSLHAAALDWLEAYTKIDYPFQKFGFALIPAFQYGGMEHIGAIQYRADSLFLDATPSETQLLGRAGLIAHETAHMWFGNLVTMEWFNDVWTKEVFANFMAAKIVNPGFPDIDHDLNFLVRHYPRAYSVDRTTGSNPIRQALPNLNEAGQMYGAIIYNKAPIMMRQLEMMIGESQFRDGMREYLSQHAFANATWPALVEILDRKSEEDLLSWSDVWVNQPGRPAFTLEHDQDANDGKQLTLMQTDRAALDRVWPQQFDIMSAASVQTSRATVFSHASATTIDERGFAAEAPLIFNANGTGYGLFPADPAVIALWERLSKVEKGALLINLYELMLEGTRVTPVDHAAWLMEVIGLEEDQLLLNLVIGEVERIFWTLLSAEDRASLGPRLEALFWQSMLTQTEASRRKMFFEAFAGILLSENAIQKIYGVWDASLKVEGLSLSENDYIDLAQSLAIRLPDQANDILAAQNENTLNPDNKRRLQFIAPSLSSSKIERDRFVASLADESMREIESWVLDALANIHHPLRVMVSEQYILQSLELLEEIQATGDIFFPKRWLDVTLRNYSSATALRTIETFLNERPDYNRQLNMKILQSADSVRRANRLVDTDRAQSVSGQ